jgi:putative PIN family toxin of toxin-antitoxin system
VLRVVLDVNVLVSALLRAPSIPAAIVHEWRAGRFELVISARLLDELHDVLGRAQIARLVAPSDANDLLVRLRELAVLVEDPPSERLVPSDPDDDYLVALARAAGAQVIVSGDADLLEAEIAPPAFSPREFLERLKSLPF